MNSECSTSSKNNVSILFDDFFSFLNQKETNSLSLTLDEWREGVKGLNHLCLLSSDLLLKRIARLTLKQWHDVVMETQGYGNILDDRNNKKIAFLIHQLTYFDDFISSSAYSDTSTSTIEPSYGVNDVYLKRSDLYSYLTHYPLFSTLLLIVLNRDEVKTFSVKSRDEDLLEQYDVQWWFLLLARLNENEAELNYSLCLAFDKARRNLPSIPASVPLPVLQQASLNELFHICQMIPELIDLAVYFQIKPQRKPKKKKPIYQALNQHSQNMMLDGCVVKIHTPTNIDGEDTEQYISVAQESGPYFGMTEELTHKQARLKFLIEKNGMANACRRANKKLPMGNNALTCAEFLSWLSYIAPDLLDGQLNLIEATDRKHWFLFFLKVLGLKDFDWVLINQNAKKSVEKRAKQLVYELNQRVGSESYLLLACDLFKGKKPQPGSKQYYSSQPALKVPLPWPLQSFLQLILQDISSVKRHKTKLLDAFQITEQEHNKWLNNHIKATKTIFPFKVTANRLFQTFHRFCGDKIPQVLLDYLREQGSVQMHYINAELQLMPNIIHHHWFLFLEALGRKKITKWSSENTYTTFNSETYHEQFGSAITLRQKALQLIAKRLLDLNKRFTEQLKEGFQYSVSEYIYKGSDLALLLSKFSEISGLYIHIRCAIELGLRPVKSPYPCMRHCAHGLGIWTVQDKRSHHEKEWRVLVLSEPLIELVMAYYQFQSAFQLLDSCAEDKLEQPIVTVFDGHHWCSLQPKKVESLLQCYLDRLELGSFRHTSAKSVCETAISKEQNDFSQSELNVLMNHFEQGQSPMLSYQLLSMPYLVKKQRDMLARSTLTPIFSDLDKQCIDSLALITKEKRYVI